MWISWQSVRNMHVKKGHFTAGKNDGKKKRPMPQYIMILLFFNYEEQGKNRIETSGQNSYKETKKKTDLYFLAF